MPLRALSYFIASLQAYINKIQAVNINLSKEEYVILLSLLLQVPSNPFSYVTALEVEGALRRSRV